MEKLDMEQVAKRFEKVKSDNGEKLNPIEAKKIIEATNDLIDPNFEAWHYKKLLDLGIYKYLELADISRKGRNPKTLFAYWLKRVGK